MALVSVVVPVYKESIYLKRLLHNLARQTWIFRTEIILCEYEPSGTSAQIISTFHQQYPDVRVRMIEIFEKGIASARNEGILRAQGQIICNLDADNIFSDDFCLENLCAPIVEGQAVMTHSRIRIDLSEARNEKELQKMKMMYVVDQLPFIITGICVLKNVWEECGGLRNIDPYEMAAFALSVFWRYPGKIKKIEEATVLTSARRTLKEKELGVLEHTFSRNTAVRGDKIIWGDKLGYDTDKT